LKTKSIIIEMEKSKQFNNYCFSFQSRNSIIIVVAAGRQHVHFFAHNASAGGTEETRYMYQSMAFLQASSLPLALCQGSCLHKMDSVKGAAFTKWIL